MKIVLATFGSLGDVQPMLALSLSLKSAGHDVLLAAPPEKAKWVEQQGCPFHPLGDDVTAFIDDMKDAHSFHSAVHFVRYVRKELISQFDIFPKIIAGADLVIGASLVFALSSVAESMGIEYRFIAFTPQLLPSGKYPFMAFKHHWLPKWYNRMTWQIARILDRINLTLLINKKRKQLGLKPVDDAWFHILGKHVIVASDKAIAKVPQDVEPAFTQTGYMHLDQPNQHLPELEAFLSAGPPPVYAGFGSMPKKDQANNVPIVVNAARSAGQRVVIGKFWDEPSEFSNSDDVFFIKRYPHLKLFPHMAAVIHHGGAGTTAASAISGVPQIIVPHILDQYYWGHQVYQSHLGPKPIWRSKLTYQKLSTAIQECLSNDLIQQRAKAASEIINQQNSLEMTSSLLTGSINQ
ncbi:MAG: glycosyltransferase family 1 protein [Deltaproteobacteria bacterium]|nr:glycosyltransferase family 1 protein [Deltaproteobacteria bacterium]